jgi:hypothetical protein
MMMVGVVVVLVAITPMRRMPSSSFFVLRPCTYCVFPLRWWSEEGEMEAEDDDRMRCFWVWPLPPPSTFSRYILEEA